MAEPPALHHQLGEAAAAAAVLSCWRAQGPEAAARCQQQLVHAQPQLAQAPLQRELRARLAGEPGPRLLIDGLWFCRPFGGITRVWDQILSTWALPGLLSEAAPVCLIERDSHLARSGAFPWIEGPRVDPIDPVAVASLADDNAALAAQWGAQVFLSSWISSTGASQPAIAELALVHDCLPERYGVPEPLRGLRCRWLQGASRHLAVSADTAADLETLLSRPQGSLPWCHPAPASLFAETLPEPEGRRLWDGLRQRAGLRPPYVVLPATSAIGSYKNPELVAQALQAPPLQPLQLVLCGIAADQRRLELEQRYPHLQGRALAVGLSDLELTLVYRHALAVVLPSHAEGFGLPAVEAMASGAAVLVADSRGLREAGGGAALRFGSRRPDQLAQLLGLLLSPQGPDLQRHLQRRRRQRLDALHPDLLGLALLALARSVALT